MGTLTGNTFDILGNFGDGAGKLAIATPIFFLVGICCVFDYREQREVYMFRKWTAVP